MAVALDRSGSMRASVGDGRTKMDLANLGACAAVELLSAIDAVAVIAVDSSPHVVVPIGEVQDKPAILSRIRSIESMGGGIFTFTALQAAAQQLAKAVQGNKHIVLFADAADAEEPGNYKTFVPELVRAGVTVSVIGLGRDRDKDAAFLQDVAKLGGGRCFFVQDPAELPRVFAQETIQVARSAVVEQPTAVDAGALLLALSPLLRFDWPQVGGYTVAWPKPQSDIAVRTGDEQRAPFFATWQHGLGRAAAFLGEADGDLSGGLASWPHYADFFATVTRWLAGNDAKGVFADLQRQGHEAVLRVEVEAGSESELAAVGARVLDSRGQASDVPLVRVGERMLEARIPLLTDGVYRAAVRVGDRFLRVPPVSLPYSPEFEPRADPELGRKTLQRLAEVAGGKLDPLANEIWRGEREGHGQRPLAPVIGWLVLALLLLEIALRRLRVGRHLSLHRRVRGAAAAPAAPGPGPPAPGPPAPGTVQPAPGLAPGAAAPSAAPAPGEPAAQPEPSLDSILDRARARGRARG
jgi:hypothetical protein